MKVYAVQSNIAWEDKPRNFLHVRDLLDLETIEPESLIVLPEMFATGFSMNKDAISEGEPETTEAFLTELAHKQQAYVLGGLVSLSVGGKGQNVAMACSPSGSTIAHYQKLHPFSYSGESNYYDGGDKLTLFECGDFTIAPFICYDLRFPEVFRHAVQLGATCFAVIACWPAARTEHWMALLKARAIENQSYVIGVNRCGEDPKLAYSGRSQIISPRGEILLDAGEHETVASTDIDIEEVASFRREFPALKDIREEYRIE
jgi:predicted amidohydrolase